MQEINITPGNYLSSWYSPVKVVESWPKGSMESLLMNLVPAAVLVVLKLKRRLGMEGWKHFLTRKLFRHVKFVSQWGKSFVSSDCPDHMIQPFDNWVSAGDVCERWPFDLGRNAVKVGNVLSARPLREHRKQFQPLCLQDPRLVLALHLVLDD